MRREPFVFKWSAEAEAYFTKVRVFLHYPWRIKHAFRAGQVVSIPYSLRTEPYSCMPKGGFASMGAFSYSRSNILPRDFRCGRYCSIAPGVELSDAEHPMQRYTTHVSTYRATYAKVVSEDFGVTATLHRHGSTGPAPDIGHDVWIGAGALLKRGIKIGHGAVVGARALVTKDVAPYTIVAGVPAKPLRQRFPDKIVERLLALQWWRFLQAEFSDLDPADIEAFIDAVGMREASGTLKPMKIEPIALADGLKQHLEAAADQLRS